MLSTCGNKKMWEITDLRPLWEKCCRDLGIDPCLVKVYFWPIDEVPFWSALDNHDNWYQPAAGEAHWEDGYSPEVIVFLDDFINNGFWGLLAIREIIYHELTHVILMEAGEEEVAQLADIITRRRINWQYCRSYLRSEAFKRKLGPPQESSTLFQWAKRKKLRFGEITPWK